MTADRAAQVEKIARAMIHAATDALDLMRNEIRAETLEEAAREMERLNIYNAAAAIRALKGDSNGR